MDNLSTNRSLYSLPASGIGSYISQNSGKDILYHFDMGSPNVRLDEILKEPVESLFGKTPLGYGSGDGEPELRELLAAAVNSERGTAISAQNIVMTCGANGALSSVLKTILNPGDIVLIPSPCWPNYEGIVTVCGGRTMYYEPELHKEYLEIDPERISKGQKPKAIIINSPHNPTGKIFSAKAIAEIISYACENDIFLIFDEAYHGIIFDNEEYAKTQFPCLYNTIYIRSFSKYYLSPALRAGYAYGDSHLMELVSRTNHLLIGSIDKLCQNILLNILKNEASISIFSEKVKDYKDYAAHAEALCQGTEGKITLIKPQGSFYLFMKLSHELDMDLYLIKLIDKYKTLVLPGYIFGRNIDSYMRISLAGEARSIKRGLENLALCAEECPCAK